MAIGIARIFGIRLPINFDSPLRASGIMDFYKRWHITLTRVIARFLFMPLSFIGARWAAEYNLGRTASKIMSTWLPLFLNFEVIALWHGPLPTFIVFGVVHGLWYVSESEMKSTKAWRNWRRSAAGRVRLLGRVATFLPLMLTFALFGSSSLDSFGRLLAALFYGGPDVVSRLGVTKLGTLLTASAAAIVWFLPNSNEFLRRYQPGIFSWINPPTTPAAFRAVWRPNVAGSLFAVVLAAACIWGLTFKAPFIYLGF